MLEAVTMEAVVDRANLRAAYLAVKANDGAPGVDGMEVGDLRAYWERHGEGLLRQLQDGTYRPAAVRGVEIPKPKGGKRLLGIPTVLDRLLQQALLQVLGPVFDPGFSDSSYGFRPNRSAHDAVRAAQGYVVAGKKWVVDIDLKNFFDQVDHDRLMASSPAGSETSACCGSSEASSGHRGAKPMAAKWRGAKERRKAAP